MKIAPTSSTLCIFLIKFSEYVHQTLKYSTYEQCYALVMLYRIANVFIFGVEWKGGLYLSVRTL